MRDEVLKSSLVILAGGKNSRMGQNKAFLVVDRQSIIERIVDRLGTLFEEIIIVTNSPELYGDLRGVRVVSDVFPFKGPLSGIHAGLTYSTCQKCLVVACDMPFVSKELARDLLKESEGWDVTVPFIDGKYQPLFAVYSNKCLPFVLAQLESGNFKITAFYDKVQVKRIDPVVMVERHYSPAKAFYNVNTPAELEEARQMADENKKHISKEYVKAWRWKAGNNEIIEDSLVVEKPLTVYLNDQEIVTLLCSPENLDELALGFLVSEGLLKGDAGEVKVRIDEERGMAWITSPKASLIAEQTFLKRYITTGCGKGTTFYNVLDAQIRPVEEQLVVDAEKVSQLMAEVQQASQLFRETGGVHLTALCSTAKMLFYREDIGRHNALDKIVGRCFLDGIPVGDKILFTTGRLSSEILLKVAKLGVPVLVSRSAPTSLAVGLAQKLGVTLVGFARAGRLSVYANEQRVSGGEAK